MFDDLKNSFDFYLRNKIRFSRKNFVEKNKDLIERNKAENLYTKAVLEQAFIDQTSCHLLLTFSSDIAVSKIENSLQSGVATLCANIYAVNKVFLCKFSSAIDAPGKGKFVS